MAVEIIKRQSLSYSTYNYWRKKYLSPSEASRALAPISFRSSSSSPSSFAGDVPSGATLLFPNGLRAHFGCGTEDVLMALLNKSLPGHVLPE